MPVRVVDEHILTNSHVGGLLWRVYMVWTRRMGRILQITGRFSMSLGSMHKHESHLKFVTDFWIRIYSPIPIIKREIISTHGVLCETRWVVKGNPKGCRVPKLMESVVFQDFCIYHFLHCKMKTHQLVVAFFNEICSKKNWKIYNIKCHKISREFTTQCHHFWVEKIPT